MKISLNIPLKDFTREAIKELGKEVLVKDIVLRCLEVGENERLGLKATPEQRIKAFDLGMKIVGQPEVDFTPEDIVYIKERLDKLFGSSAVIYTQCVKAFEEKTQEKI